MTENIEPLDQIEDDPIEMPGLIRMDMHSIALTILQILRRAMPILRMGIPLKMR